MNELKQNASYHNLTHKLNRILESKSNSAKRFPKGRVLGSKTHIFQVFRQE
ncbi:hypothetical protein [Leptospira noguchii]|uniref:hypothetical protein n=1 Tax=Leptospira noguchii TaxID=28182 RepID=UPI001FB80187|nr:hypothetical protein [Leptospira noguchii]UOG61609.1 hypothetical protein MAL07_06305 [Leptospira noguchii]